MLDTVSGHLISRCMVLFYRAVQTGVFHFVEPDMDMRDVCIIGFFFLLLFRA